MELGKAGDLDAAFPLIRSAAEAGLAQAQFTLGTMYTHGQGVPQSKAMAREWYHRAAGQDHPEAIYNIGLHYDQGLEIEQNLATALSFYERASALGHAEAAYNAGHILFMGDGVEEFETVDSNSSNRGIQHLLLHVRVPQAIHSGHV